MNPNHPIASWDEWLAARKELLKKEKTLTRQRDELSRQRRALPWVKVEKPFVFDTPNGKETLADLFDRRRQLIVYHFMFGPDPKWKEGCPSVWQRSRKSPRHTFILWATISSPARCSPSTVA
jgi:predicted dithiol-disulfide oxidoreductase (DUF899 family)